MSTSAPEKGDVLKIEGWRPYIKQEGQAFGMSLNDGGIGGLG